MQIKIIFATFDSTYAFDLMFGGMNGCLMLREVFNLKVE